MRVERVAGFLMLILPRFASRAPLRAFAAAACLLIASTACGQDLPAIPPLTARVTDTAGMLTADQRSALESVLADYEQQKGTQIAVLTVASTAPEAIEQYGIRVADAWKIGRKGTADGVILIVAKDNPSDLRRLRIEVGKGVEGAIPDALAKRIINEDISPHFRNNDFYGGMVAGVSRIKSLLEGESLPAPKQRDVARTGGSGGSGGSGLGIGVPLLFFLFIIVSGVFRAMGRRRVGYMSGNRALNRSIAPLVIGGLLGSLAGRGGFGGGGFGGGGGGGGFGGGGGDFGGGGASGDW